MSKRRSVVEKKKLLIVEDEVGTREAWKEALSAEGYKVYTLGSGVHVKKEIKKTKPDLVILDLAMPETGREEGFRVLEDMSRIHPRVPVIIATGTYEREEVEKTLRDIGCRELVSEIMIKAFSNSALIEAVQEVLRSSDG
jgi:DNA-binding NtrC family response regulator